MNIGILGSGNVGGALGRRWAQNGHAIVFASRNPKSVEMKDLVAGAGVNATAASAGEAVKQSDILLLATPWLATKGVVEGAGNLIGKILIDATNPLLPDLSGLEVGTVNSGGELVAQWAKGAKVVKAFNTVGANIMADSAFPEGKAVVFYCGDDARAKETVQGLVSELGFDARDAGPLRQSRLLEPLAHLWISLAFQQGYGREFAFSVMKRG